METKWHFLWVTPLDLDACILANEKDFSLWIAIAKSFPSSQHAGITEIDRFVDLRKLILVSSLPDEHAVQ